MTDILDLAAGRTPLRSSGFSTDVFGVVKNVDVVCSPSVCVRSPRSRLSPRAIVGRPESRQGDLHLAALPLSPGAMSADLDDDWRIRLLDVARHLLIGLQQGRGY
jgi:hypothetical protein